jgi:hypothetical protein
MTTPVRIALSEEGQMLDQMSLSRLGTCRAEAKALPHCDVFGVVTSRKFWPCEFDGVAY